MIHIRYILPIFVFLMCGNYLFGQTPTKIKPPPAIPDSELQETQTVEEVDGIWELTGYLGKKLMNEMGNRMNLVETKIEVKNEVIKTKKVKIQIGLFKIERIETI